MLTTPGLMVEYSACAKRKREYFARGITVKKKRSNKVTAGDVILTLLVVVASVASMVLIARATAGDKGSTAVVEVNAKEVLRIELSDSQPRRTYTVQGMRGPSTIEVEKGRARMLSSTCRDKICVGAGWVEAPGKDIICLPNRVVVRITGERKPGRVDTVTE